MGLSLPLPLSFPIRTNTGTTKCTFLCNVPTLLSMTLCFGSINDVPMPPPRMHVKYTPLAWHAMRARQQRTKYHCITWTRRWLDPRK